MAAEQVPGYRSLPPRYSNGYSSRSSADRIASYLAHMTPGGVMTSNFIAMCEVSSSDQVRHVECTRCKGLGAGDPERWWEVKEWERDLEGLEKRGAPPKKIAKLRRKIHDARHCSRCDGTGYIERNATREAADKVWNTVRCGKCRGCGEVVNEDAEDECPRCSGDGCVVPQTVRSTGSSKKGKLPPGATSMTEEAWLPPEPEDERDTEELVQTSNVLRAVHEDDAVSARATQAYYGPEGDRWKLHPWGQAFSLWPLTRGGAALSELFLKRGELRGAGHLVRVMDRIVAEREAESHASTPDMLRRSLISKADREARLLEARMRDAISAAEGRVG